MVAPSATDTERDEHDDLLAETRCLWRSRGALLGTQQPARKIRGRVSCSPPRHLYTAAYKLPVVILPQVISVQRKNLA